MSKILSSEKAIVLSQKLRNENKTIVLAGGCFDILHIGHITFLKQAKKKGDFLFILLESDESIRQSKGGNRPINSLEDRTRVLEALMFADVIIPLQGVLRDEDYDKLILAIKPAIIATNKADPNRIHKKRQAARNNSKLVDVGEVIRNQSTSRIAKLLQK